MSSSFSTYSIGCRIFTWNPLREPHPQQKQLLHESGSEFSYDILQDQVSDSLCRNSKKQCYANDSCMRSRQKMDQNYMHPDFCKLKLNNTDSKRNGCSKLNSSECNSGVYKYINVSFSLYLYRSPLIATLKNVKEIHDYYKYIYIVLWASKTFSRAILYIFNF